MARVYSTRFVDLHAASHGALVGAPGVLTVIRDIDVFQGATGTSEFIAVESPSGGIFAYFEFAAGVSAGGQWRGRQVIYPTETVNFGGSSSFDIMISGYSLSLP